MKREPKARASRGVWGRVPLENFYFYGLRNNISHIFKGKFHESKHEKNIYESQVDYCTTDETTRKCIF